jgi:purine nucleoside permease
VTMFESGADTGDRPGELQYWVERNHLDKILPFPQAYHDLRMNRDGVLAVLTGMGTAKAAGSIMALGLDPRFDLRKSYWIVAGIAGVDPADASLGSAAWAEWVVRRRPGLRNRRSRDSRRLAHRLRAARQVQAL